MYRSSVVKEYACMNMHDVLRICRLHVKIHSQRQTSQSLVLVFFTILIALKMLSHYNWLETWPTGVARSRLLLNMYRDIVLSQFH